MAFDENLITTLHGLKWKLNQHALELLIFWLSLYRSLHAKNPQKCTYVFNLKLNIEARSKNDHSEVFMIDFIESIRTSTMGSLNSGWISDGALNHPHKLFLLGFYQPLYICNYSTFSQQSKKIYRKYTGVCHQTNFLSRFLRRHFAK